MRFISLMLLALPAVAQAHFHMLLPERVSIKQGESVQVTFLFGHPFESEWFDTEKPERARVFDPSGKATDVLAKLEKVELPRPDNKKVVAYRYTFTPEHRGDFTLVFESPPVWMADEKHFLKDAARVVIHVQAQKSWDLRQIDAKEFGIVPMTRPYGLRAGTIFQAKAGTADDGGPHMIEVEHYHALPPKALPADELITLTLKTDERGVATCTLPESGWWVINATRRADRGYPSKEREGKKYPIIVRASLWVYVEAPSQRAD